MKYSIFLVFICFVLLFGCQLAGGLGVQAESDSGDQAVLSMETGLGFVPGELEDLSEEVVQQIKGLYWFYQRPGIDEVNITGYYGTYNGCVVFFIPGDFLWGIMGYNSVVIAGIEFVYQAAQGGLRIIAWKDGEFYYHLNEAYNQGLLTQEDLQSIADIHHSGELSLEGLDEETELRIRQDYVMLITSIEEIYIKSYYGTYNGWVAYKVDTQRETWSIKTEIIAGVTVPEMRVYHPGQRKTVNSSSLSGWRHYFLRAAYDEGFLTKADIESIAYYHYNGKALGPYYW